jgi:glycosyltransferase involved in cell wall biosynthesis
MPDKRQIVFISRVLWAGGAERVVYDLAHHLDQERFEVHIVCLFEQQDLPISFDSRISIHNIDPVQYEPTPQNPGIIYILRKRLYFGAKKAYGFLVPTSLRKSLKLEERLLAPLRTKALSSSLPNNIEYAEISWVLQAIQNINPSLIGLQQVLTKFRKDAILIPVMEEATVRVWLSQLFKRHIYIASLHSVESYNMSLIYSDPTVRSVEEWLFANACRSADIVTVPSNGCRHDLIINYGISPQQIKVISNPVDAVSIIEKSQFPLDSIPNEKKTSFVYVGRLDFDKNPELLIDAASLLKKQYSDFMISYIGKGALHSKLSTRIKEMGLQDNVILLGEVSNPFPYMKRSRALVLTSHVESFALVLVEAMLCGTVPIAVDCPYGPREVLDHGKYGLLVPQNDPQALADAMWQIANDDDLYLRMRALGPERALSYNISETILDWENLLSKYTETSYS